MKRAVIGLTLACLAAFLCLVFYVAYLQLTGSFDAARAGQAFLTAQMYGL